MSSLYFSVRGVDNFFGEAIYGRASMSGVIRIFVEKRDGFNVLAKQTLWDASHGYLSQPHSFVSRIASSDFLFQ